MKHFIVNIGCEYGSGGPDIGKMVAESLGIPFYDRDLVDQVVEKLGVDRDLVEKADSGEENVKYEFDIFFSGIGFFYQIPVNSKFLYDLIY